MVRGGRADASRGWESETSAGVIPMSLQPRSETRRCGHLGARVCSRGKRPRALALGTRAPAAVLHVPTPTQSPAQEQPQEQLDTCASPEAFRVVLGVTVSQEGACRAAPSSCPRHAGAGGRPPPPPHWLSRECLPWRAQSAGPGRSARPPLTHLPRSRPTHVSLPGLLSSCGVCWLRVFNFSCLRTEPNGDGERGSLSR